MEVVMKKIILFLFISVFFPLCMFAQNSQPSYFSLNLTPGLNFPVGSDKDYFNLGGGVGVSGEYRLPAKPVFYLSGGIGYSFIPVTFETSLSVVSFGAGAGAHVDLGKRFFLKGYTNGGFYYSLLNDRSGPRSGNPFVIAGSGLRFLITPQISVGVEGAYTNYFGLYNGITLSLGTAYHFKPRGERSIRGVRPATPELLSGREYLEIEDVSFEDIFPVFFKYYDDHPIGKAVLHNKTDKPITDISLSLFVKQYMDNPKECSVPSELAPGEKHEIELNSLFTEKVLEITESTKASAEITIEFSVNDNKYADNYIETIRLYDRNATTWDDDRRAAAFVTAKDPAVLTFSKNISGIVKEKGSRAVNQNLRMAMALHEALSLYGMNYVIDPKTPYKEFSAKKTEVDFLQFPRQTFQYRAGDCDDLSILYSSLFESVGIETAFITVPGHIFIAFSLDMSADEGRKNFLNAENLIFMNGQTWIPVEVTEIDGGFLKAWKTGAKEWREAVAREQEGFLPLHECWKLFEPVGLPGAGPEVTVPSKESILDGYTREVVSFIDREIYPRLAEIQAEIKKTGGAAKSINKLGVLYARYGLNDRAQREFLKILEKDKIFVPAIINLGNIYYLSGDMKKAKSYYEQAYQIKPDSATVLLCVARVNHELENYGTVKDAYGKLKEKNPDLARQFAYLDLRGDDAARAASIGNLKEVVVWEE